MRPIHHGVEVDEEWLAQKGTHQIVVGRSTDPKDEIM
jgi:hypothetical protein